MDQDLITATIKGLSEDAKFLAKAWNDDDEFRVATTINSMRAVLCDVETMLKDDLYRRLTAKSAFTEKT